MAKREQLSNKNQIKLNYINWLNKEKATFFRTCSSAEMTFTLIDTTNQYVMFQSTLDEATDRWGIKVERVEM